MHGRPSKRPDPTEAEIAAAREAIQATWNDTDRIRRWKLAHQPGWQTSSERQQYEIPVDVRIFES